MQVKVRQSGVKRKDRGLVGVFSWVFYSIFQYLESHFCRDKYKRPEHRGMLGAGFGGRFSWLFYLTYVGRRVGEEGSSEIKGNSCDLHPRQLCTTRSDAGLEKDETDFPNTRIEMSDYFEKSSQRWIWFQLVARSLVVWLLDWSHQQSGTGGRWGFARRRKQHVDTVPKIERRIFCLQGH